MNISEIFSQVAYQMRADFDCARAAINHPGLKGNAFERAFREFLRKYLPAGLDISTGQIVDSVGGISKQIDIIISDAAKTPVFYQSHDTRVVPIECVYTVIEVKADLTLIGTDSVFENMRSVKQLKKTAFLPYGGPLKMYGKEWPIWPMNYFAFAFEGAELGSIAQRLQNLTINAAAPPEARVDMVCVLNRGVICNQDKDGSCDALPSASSHLFTCSTSQSLLLFYSLASKYFNQTSLPPFRFKDYLRGITFS